MFEAMSQVRIVGHRPRLDATLEVLRRLQVIQIADLSHGADASLRALVTDEARARDLGALQQLRTRIASLLQLLPADAAPPVPAEDEAAVDWDALRGEIDALAPEVESAVVELDALRTERDVLPRHIQAVRRLLPLVPDLAELVRYETVALLLERRHAALLGLLEEEMKELAGAQYRIVSAQVDPTTVGAVVVFPREVSQRVHSLLGRERVSEVRLPPAFKGLPLPQAIAAMQVRLAELPRLIEEGEAQVRALVMPVGERLQRALVQLERRLEVLRELGKLATTGRTFVLQGWVPSRRVSGLRDELQSRVGGEVLVSERTPAPEEAETAPVCLRNPGPARPFEMFLKLFALPRYRTLDPTPLMALFIPIFFGIMLGDVGYGVVLLGIALGLRRKRESEVVRSLSAYLTYGAISAIAFGFAFGELFGGLGKHIGLHPLWLDREAAVAPLILLAVAIGAAHVLLGLALGVILSWRAHHFRDLAERAGQLVALVGLLLLAATVARALPPGFMTPAVAAVVVGMAAVLVAHGRLGLLMAPLEVLRGVGNILSYLRLAALGLASVYLARVANEIGALAPLWLGILIAALFHALNLALGVFSPTVQALRLHYVEFFRGFFEEGGRAFEPFGGPSSRQEAPPG